MIIIKSRRDEAKLKIDSNSASKNQIGKIQSDSFNFFCKPVLFIDTNISIILEKVSLVVEVHGT